jgi:hypothetical protein
MKENNSNKQTNEWKDIVYGSFYFITCVTLYINWNDISFARIIGKLFSLFVI